MVTHVPQPVEGVAFNQVPTSENEIHGDEVARRHGFRGGLVPGVTVSAYVCDPAVRAWGLDFLQRGRARVVVKRPLYDRESFRVVLDAAEQARYEARLLSSTEDTLCAEGEVSLPAGDAMPAPPVRRGDPRRPEGARRTPATRDDLERLREVGMWSMPAEWSQRAEIWTYYREQAAMPELLRYDAGGYANMGFVLGLTNWHLASNVKLGPWLHLETEAQLFAPIERGEKLVVEGAVADLFEKKGHHFVDVDVAAYRRSDSVAVMATRLRAIYRLRQPA